MVKTSFLGYFCDDIYKAFEKHKGFRINRNSTDTTGMQGRKDQSGGLPVQDSDGFYMQSQCIVLPGLNEEEFEFACKAIKQSKHIFICNISEATPQKIETLLKLQNEAKVTIHFSRFGILLPGILNAKKIIRNPDLVELRDTLPLSTPEKQPEEIKHSLFRMTDAVLTLIPSNNRRTFVNKSSTNTGLTGLLNIRLEFENGCVACMLLSPFIEEGSLEAAIYTTDQCCLTNQSASHITVSKVLFNNTGKSVKKIVAPVMEDSNRILINEIDGFYNSVTRSSGYPGNTDYVRKWVNLTCEILQKTNIAFRMSIQK